MGIDKLKNTWKQLKTNLQAGTHIGKINKEVASRDILDRVGMRVPDKVAHNIQGDIKINIDLS